jgi:hypothetical protein
VIEALTTALGVSPEALLMLAIGAFVLGDSVQALRPHEALIHPAGSGWRGVLAARAVTLRARRLVVPNLFALHRPLFRMRWSPLQAEPPAPGSTVISAAQRNHADEASAGWAYGQALMLFGLLPLTLWRAPNLAMLGLSVLLIYGIAWGAAWWVKWRHAALGLTAQQARDIGIECAMCPVFVVNLVRRVSAHRWADADFAAQAKQLLAPDDWLLLRDELLEEVSGELEAASANPKAQQRLRDWQNYLKD